MMRYLPHTDEDVAAMLSVIGAGSLDDLFESIPADCRRREPLRLPESLTEWELDRHMAGLSERIAAGSNGRVFLGAGSYEHHIPAAVAYLLGRSEFSTAYTPYQPEISQGTLQAIFEYQTLTARLLGMEVANASIYDGASALAEGLLMAVRIGRRKRIAVSRLIHPHYRRVIQTYFRPTGCEILELPYAADGRTDLTALQDMDDLAAVAVQSPNFFGCIEDLGAAAQIAHERQALLVTSFTEALAYGLIKNPGCQGADIVAGEGQSLGMPRSFGGPYLGMFAARMKHVRNMPGRLVGQTVDKDGRRGYVLTLATREQHIRREKATSNICTNNSLCALTASIYMASLGGSGMRRLAALNRDKCEYLKRALCDAGCGQPFDGATFNEFVAAFPAGFEETYRRLRANGVIAGLSLASFYPELEGHYLLCVTETKSREDMDALVREVQS